MAALIIPHGLSIRNEENNQTYHFWAKKPLELSATDCVGRFSVSASIVRKMGDKCVPKEGLERDIWAEFIKDGQNPATRVGSANKEVLAIALARLANLVGGNNYVIDGVHYQVSSVAVGDKHELELGGVAYR